MRRLAIIALLCPGVALACALPASIILTLPTGYYMAGAAVTVAVTGLLAAAPQYLPQLRPATLLQRRTLLKAGVTNYLAWVIFSALILIGFFGAVDPMHNLLTLVVWTGVWVALPMASMVFGNLWRPINPWTAPVRLMRTLLGNPAPIGLARFGYAPAVAGLAGFFWFYIISLSPEDPATLATAALLYWLIIFAAAVAEGEDWLENGEFLTVYMGFIARVAPVWTEAEGGRVRVNYGWPGAQIINQPALPPTGIAFVTLALAGLSFDGLSATFWWLNLIGENPLEFTGRSAVAGVNTAGLLAVWAVTTAAILLVLRAGSLMVRGPVMVTSAGTLSGTGPGANLMPVMLSFLAIAAGYHSAHYLTVLLTSGQYTLAALNDPFFRGDDWLGLPPFYVSMGFLADRGVMTLIWNTQFALIVGAHALAVILALRLSPPDLPARAHLPLTLLMIGYTIFGLWLLSSPSGY